MKVYFRDSFVYEADQSKRGITSALKTAIAEVKILGSLRTEIEVSIFAESNQTSDVCLEILITEHPDGGITGVYEMKKSLVKLFSGKLDERNIFIVKTAY